MRMRSPTLAPSVCAKGPAASASPTPLTYDAPYHRTGCDHLQWRHLCVQRGPAAPAGLMPLTGDTAPCRSAGRDHLHRCYRCMWKGRQHQQALHLLGAMQHCAIVPDVITYNVAISAHKKGQQHQRALFFTACDAALRHRAGGSHLQCSRQCIRKGSAAPKGLRCGAMPSGRMGTPTVLPSACAAGQQYQQAYHLLRAMRRHVIVPDVFTYNAAISLCDGAAASAGITSPSSDAASCHRAGCVHL